MFTSEESGKEEIIGGATAAKRYLRAQVETVPTCIYCGAELTSEAPVKMSDTEWEAEWEAEAAEYPHGMPW